VNPQRKSRLGLPHCVRKRNSGLEGAGIEPDPLIFKILGRRSKQDRLNQLHNKNSRANQPGFVVFASCRPPLFLTPDHHGSERRKPLVDPLD
jgi:hypothetical protein